MKVKNAVTFRFQRDTKDSRGRGIYLYYHTNVGTDGWYIANETDFREKNDKSYVYFYTSGKKSNLDLFAVNHYALH